MISPESKGMEN